MKYKKERLHKKNRKFFREILPDYHINCSIDELTREIEKYDFNNRRKILLSKLKHDNWS